VWLSWADTGQLGVAPVLQVSQNYDAARSGNVDAILGGSQYNKQQ
jgi:hypothetical protein